MKDFRIHIESIELEKPLNAVFNLPECWDEVPADLYPHLTSIYLATDKQMPEHDKTVRAFSLLTWTAWPSVSLLTDEELYSLLHHIDWVFDKLDISINLQPVLEIGGVKLYGPANGCINLRFAEWCYADTFYMNYCRSAAPEDLVKLVATLYRPAGEGKQYDKRHESYRGDVRAKFNDQLLEERADLVNELPWPVLQGVLVFFASCRQQIISQVPHIFPQKTDGQSAEDSDEGDGWLGVYDELRGDPKFGGADRLEEEFISTVLFSQERAKIKFDALKEKYKL